MRRLSVAPPLATFNKVDYEGKRGKIKVLEIKKACEFPVETLKT